MWSVLNTLSSYANNELMVSYCQLRWHHFRVVSWRARYSRKSHVLNLATFGPFRKPCRNRMALLTVVKSSIGRNQYGSTYGGKKFHRPNASPSNAQKTVKWSRPNAIPMHKTVKRFGLFQNIRESVSQWMEK